MKFSRKPLLAAVPAALIAGSMLSAPVAGAQSSLPIPEDLLGSASGSLAPGSLGGDTCGTEVVTPNAMGAWFTPGDETKPTFVADDEAPLGDGALAFAQDAEQGTSLYKKSGAPLSSILTESGGVAMHYQFKSSAQAPALQIRILDGNVKGDDGETNGFATIVWSPAPGEAGKWTDAKASEATDFWVTRPVLEKDSNEVWLNRGDKKSLKEIIEHLNGNNKTAKVSEYGVQQTKENSATGVAVDKFVFGCETTDFEPAPAGPDFGSLALGGGLALAAALAVGGGAWAVQNGMIQLPPEIAALLSQ